MTASPPARPARPSGRSPTTRQRVREVFSKGGFRRIFWTRIASQFGDGVFQLATADILLFNESTENPVAELAALTAITLVPFSVLGPFAGVFIDRWNRRRILWYTPLGRAALAAVVPLFSTTGASAAAFYAAILVVLSANRFFLATIQAVLPQMVPEDDLLVANSAASTGGSVANTAGLGAGAAMAALFDGQTAALLAAGVFVGAAMLARAIPARSASRRPAAVGEALARVAREMAEGIRRVRDSRRATYALSAVSLTQLFVGGMTGAITYYFIGILGLDVADATALLGLIAVGIFAGVLVVPFAGRRFGEDRLIPFSFAVGLLSVFFASEFLSRPTIVVGAMFVGVSYAFVKIPVDTIVQEEIDDAHRGRAFAAYDVLFNLARVSGVSLSALAVAAGWRADTLVLSISGAYLAALVLFWWWEGVLARGGPR